MEEEQKPEEIQPQVISAPAPEERASGLAITAMVLGILAIVCSWVIGLNFALGIAALVIGIIEFKKINEKQSSEKGKGMALAGIILGAIGIFGAIIYKNDEVMGMGDVKIFAPIGIFLGWKMCAMALAISMFLGGLASILLIVLSIKKRKDTIPFGPFIAIAAFITVMWGQDIWSWYFSLL